MYQRFLNNEDYLSQISDELFQQLIRGKEIRVSQAEESAEASLIEYLTDNYEIEKELQVGKDLREYDSRITYPVGAHFYYEGQIVEAIRSINGLKSPSATEYWVKCDFIPTPERPQVPQYSQLLNYTPGDIVAFSGNYYECLEFNGMDYSDIRIPGVIAWESVPYTLWEPNVEYKQWDVVMWEGRYFALITTDNIDLTLSPMQSENWGMIGNYDVDYTYEFSPTEFVVHDNMVWVPVMPPMPDALKLGYNCRYHDPRNGNIKKHMVKIALYELHKLISPNNVSSARIADFESTMQWLNDANRCKINPQIPRKLDEDNKPVSEIVLCTFQRDYDPYKNPWQI